MSQARKTKVRARKGYNMLPLHDATNTRNNTIHQAPQKSKHRLSFASGASQDSDSDPAPSFGSRGGAPRSASRGLLFGTGVENQANPMPNFGDSSSSFSSSLMQVSPEKGSSSPLIWGKRSNSFIAEDSPELVRSHAMRGGFNRSGSGGDQQHQQQPQGFGLRGKNDLSSSSSSSFMVNTNVNSGSNWPNSNDVPSAPTKRRGLQQRSFSNSSTGSTGGNTNLWKDGFRVPSQPSQSSQPSGANNNAMDLSLPTGKGSSSFMGSQYSQGDFCTPQDADVVGKTASQVNEELHNARLPSKKVRIGGTASSTGAGADHGNSKGTVLVDVPMENPFMPLPLELKRKWRPEQVDISSRLNRDFVFCSGIDEGSFGAVLKCVRRSDGCIYAIKRSKRQALSDSSRAEMMKEAHALAALQIHRSDSETNSNHIVRYYDVWEEDQCIYLQMEYLPGGSLSSRLQRIVEAGPESKERFTTQELLTITLHISRALQHCHSAGIAHLDIKPDNILQSESGSSFVLCDFGLATPCRDPVAYVAIEGDCRYLPAEVLNSNHIELDRVDIFSLGCSLYELATNTPIGKGRIDWNIILNKDLCSDPQDIHPDFFDMVRKMLSPDPSSRPTAAMIVEFLESSK